MLRYCNIIIMANLSALRIFYSSLLSQYYCFKVTMTVHRVDTSCKTGSASNMQQNSVSLSTLGLAAGNSIYIYGVVVLL